MISETDVNAEMDGIATGLSTCITKDGQTNPTANLPMAGFKLTGLGAGSAAADSATLGQVQAQAYIWCGTAGGTADALTLTPSPAITAYAAGQTFRFIAGASPNTGAATVAISGLTTKELQNDGAALAAGDITAGKMCEIIYDGTVFQLQHVVVAIKPIAFHANKNATNQTGIATGTFTKVTFTNEVFDIGGHYDAANSKFQPTVAGKYLVGARIRWDTAVDQTQMGIHLYKNGSIYQSSDARASGTSGPTNEIWAIIDLNGSTDYVEVYAQQSSGSNKDIQAGVGNIFSNFFATRVA